MIFAVSLISTLFILLILVLLLEYRSRSRRALARRMRYYAGDMENPQDKPEERISLKERFLNLLRGGSSLFHNIRHARGLDFKMQQAGIPLLGTEFLALLLLSAVFVGAIAAVITKKWYAGILAAITIVALEYVYVLVRRCASVLG